MEWDTKLALWENYQKKSFKLRIENKLLSVLEDEDSFIEVHYITSKLKYQQ